MSLSKFLLVAVCVLDVSQFSSDVLISELVF